MPCPQPPYDRAIALPCRMSIFRDRWLAVHCRCGHIANDPIRLMMQQDSGAGARTLAETVVRTRCKGCGERPAQVYLTADGCGVNVSGGSQGWVILLHAGAYVVTQSLDHAMLLNSAFKLGAGIRCRREISRQCRYDLE